ncbi:MAG: Lrp/AsnC family transcriptional regulator [Dehalococcoidia bacterium]|nr:Lrp/AsnC family transcriptional regulator [Dehalococcoidia bacterium]
MKDIFKLLEEDARRTPEQLAVLAGLSVGEVVSIIKKAESEGVIVGYKALVNWDNVPGEEGQVWALIEVKVVPQRGVGFDGIAERISRFTEVDSLYLVSGQFDLAVIVIGKSFNEVGAFVSNKLATMEGVQGTNTHYLLKRYKDDGLWLFKGDESQRLPVSP